MDVCLDTTAGHPRDGKAQLRRAPQKQVAVRRAVRPQTWGRGTSARAFEAPRVLRVALPQTHRGD